ncbi:MAG: protein kinase [Cyanobacteria bacterium P01_A01_bin.80]
MYSSFWSSGKQIKNGKFTIENILGCGGFGVVYLAKENISGKLVALKTPNSLAQSHNNFSQFQENFVNEALCLSRCHHPHIVRVHPQLFQEEGLWCMVMDYIEGNNLGDYIHKHGQLTETEAIKIISKIGAALSFIHHQGILYRDVKPLNIMLRNNDLLSPILLDFGTAIEFDTDIHHDFVTAFTQGYAPIEQYQYDDYKDSNSLGTWTDVYGLAATLYFLLSSQTPPPSIYRPLTDSDPLISPNTYNPNISKQVNSAILAGMELKPENRPPTIKEWLKLIDIVDTIVELDSFEDFRDDNQKINNNTYHDDSKEDNYKSQLQFKEEQITFYKQELEIKRKEHITLIGCIEKMSQPQELSLSDISSLRTTLNKLDLYKAKLADTDKDNGIRILKQFISYIVNNKYINRYISQITSKHNLENEIIKVLNRNDDFSLPEDEEKEISYIYCYLKLSLDSYSKKIDTQYIIRDYLSLAGIKIDRGDNYQQIINKFNQRVVFTLLDNIKLHLENTIVNISENNYQQGITMNFHAPTYGVAGKVKGNQNIDTSKQIKKNL